MKTTLETLRSAEEKHTDTSFDQQIPVVCIIDKRGRTVWISDDPKGESTMTGQFIIENVAEGERQKILDMLGKVVLEGETVEYDVVAAAGVLVEDRRMISWRVRMWPADYAHGIAAACCVCYRLDPAYQEIKDDEIALLRHLCQDCTLVEVAHRMLLSESAIDSKIKKLKEKLRCHNIGGLVAAAMNGGIMLN